MSSNSQNMTLYQTIYETVKKNKYIIAAYVLVIICIIGVYNYISLASNDEKAFTKNFMYNIIVIIFPIILILGLLLYATYETQMPIVFYGLAGVAMFIFLIFYLLKSSLSDYIFNSYLLYVIIGGIFLVGLAIGVTMFSGQLQRMTGWKGFFANLFFYIPCLIRDGVKRVVKEYNGSSTTLLLLFMFEILLIIMYFFLIPLIYTKTYPVKTVIMEEPVMLNIQTQLTNKIPTKVKTNSNCSLSFWVYLNPASATKFGYSEETNILNYAYTSDDNKIFPHLQLAYYNEKKDGSFTGSNEFIMYVGDKKNPDNKFTITLPLQKWNNFVINFITVDSSTVPTASATATASTSVGSTEATKAISTKQYITDIFINGSLERSRTFDPIKGDIVPKFNSSDTFTIGSDINDTNSNNTINDNGLYGSICNVIHYKTPLNKFSIIHNYNLLTVNNPPIA